MLEVEAYRQLADRAIGRTIASLDASDAWFLKGGITSRELTDALVGRKFTGTRRVGKLLLMDVDRGPTLGLRFGMTGRLLVDDAIGVNELQYASHRLDTGWDRFVVHFTDGGDLRINDPRRLGGVLSTGERRRLHRQIRSTVADLEARGGSHMGDLQLARVRGGRCPKDGAELARRTVGGRTTYSCPVHQR